MPLPPKTGEETSDDIRYDIPRITRNVRHQVRPDHFEQDGPNDQLKSNLTWLRRLVVIAQFQPTLREQHDGQRARN
jgi:hypothetical protein